MTLAPLWRTRLFAAGGALLAVWLGFAIAEGEMFWPAVCLAACVAGLLSRLLPLPLATGLLGFALVCYLAGNRGFAQLYLAPTFPLLPAELVLLVGAVTLILHSVFRRELPFRADTLNLVILGWMVLGAGRLLLDARTYGFQALRDSATVYYAAFFFLARDAGRTDAGRRFLHRCLLAGCVLLLLLQFPYRQFPDFFLGTLTVRGVPLIYYKGDLVGICLAVGAVLFFMRSEISRRWWPAVVSLTFVAGAISTGNRAAMLGLLVATALLAAGGRWRFAAVQAGTGVVATAVILLAARVADIPLANTPLYGLYERVVSMTDPLGERSYLSADAADKGDNNVFRAVWWRAVFDETMENGPYTGLGFGYSLADRFVREYYPDAGDEFNTRSPHNILLTVFARMGFAGLIPFLALIVLLAVRTLRTIRTGAWETAGLWCSAWVVLVSACFGVVLEGPMGAVMFWTLIGLASATDEAAASDGEPEAAVLPQAEGAAEVAPVP